MQVPRHHPLAVDMRSWTHIDVIRWFEHSEVGQSRQAATQDLNQVGTSIFFSRWDAQHRRSHRVIKYTG
jgi:hypothetical protein